MSVLNVDTPDTFRGLSKKKNKMRRLKTDTSRTLGRLFRMNEGGIERCDKGKRGAKGLPEATLRTIQEKWGLNV